LNLGFPTKALPGLAFIIVKCLWKPIKENWSSEVKEGGRGGVCWLFLKFQIRNKWNCKPFGKIFLKHLICPVLRNVHAITSYSQSQNQTWQVKPKPARSNFKFRPGFDFDLAGLVFNLPGLS
jgi:hypothetical protein